VCDVIIASRISRILRAVAATIIKILNSRWFSKILKLVVPPPQPPPFEIGAPPFHVCTLGFCIHPMLYFKKVPPPSGFWPLLLVFGHPVAKSWQRAWSAHSAKVQKIRITRCGKSRFYPVLAKIQINRRFLQRKTLEIVRTTNFIRFWRRSGLTDFY